MMTIESGNLIIHADLVEGYRFVKALLTQVLAFFRKTWAQLRNPYRPERRYMRGSQIQSGK